MLTKTTISAIIFDMDGLMFDTERLAIRAWQQAGKEHGFELPEPLILECVGRPVQSTQAHLETVLGPGFDFNTVRRRRVEIAEEVFARDGVPIKEGLYELLDLLNNQPIGKAVATSTERSRAESMLRRATVFDHFDVVVCGDEVEHGKPAPDIFLLAAERLGAEPTQCIVLEDSDPGIQAAAAAGMIPILVPDIRPPSTESLKIAFNTFENLNHVADYFGGIFQMENL